MHWGFMSRMWLICSHKSADFNLIKVSPTATSRLSFLPQTLEKNTIFFHRRPTTLWVFIIWLSVRVKFFKVSKVQGPWPLECLYLRSLSFNSMTSWHHTTSPCHTCAELRPIFMVEENYRADQKHGEWCWLRCVWTDQSEPTGHSG